MDVWANGSIFERWRTVVRQVTERCDDPEGTDAFVAELEKLPEVTVETGPAVFYAWCPCLLAELLTCKFCQRYQLPFWILVWLLITAMTPSWAQELLRLPVYSLAITRILTLLGKVFDVAVTDKF